MLSGAQRDRRGDDAPGRRIGQFAPSFGCARIGIDEALLNGRDVTQEELAKLRPDIEYLESVLARIRSTGKSHA